MGAQRGRVQRNRRRPPNLEEEWERADPSLIDLNIPEARKVLANDLEAITPDDLAQSDRLEWLYFIRNGKVHKVGSYSEVRTLAR